GKRFLLDDESCAAIPSHSIQHSNESGGSEGESSFHEYESYRAEDGQRGQDDQKATAPDAVGEKSGKDGCNRGASEPGRADRAESRPRHTEASEVGSDDDTDEAR